MNLLIIDGNNFVYRCQSLKSCTITLDSLSNQYAFGVVVFDIDRSKERIELYPRYKQGRHVNQEMNRIMCEFNDWLFKHKYPVMSRYNEEADDVIAQLLWLAKDKVGNVGIVSNDHDFWQHITDNVVVFDDNGFMTRQDILEEYNIEPYRLPEVWAIMGDEYDNIPGFATKEEAIKLISWYGNLGMVLAHSQLKKYKKEILRNLQLIQHNAIKDVDINFEELSLKRYQDYFKGK